MNVRPRTRREPVGSAARTSDLAVSAAAGIMTKADSGRVEGQEGRASGPCPGPRSAGLRPRGRRPRRAARAATRRRAGPAQRRSTRSHLASPDYLAYAVAVLLFLERCRMQPERRVGLFRNGRNQALRIPRALELDADEATIRSDAERLIVKPVKRRPDLATLLAGWEPLDEPLPDVDEGPLPLDDIRL